MANTDGPWIRFYASDWLAGTRGMTAAETGVYITLIALMYERDDSLIERDDKRLARMCGLKQYQFASILDDLIEQRKIIAVEAKLGNDRATIESQNRVDRANKARNAALAKAERIQGAISARAPAKQAPSSARGVLRARGSEPEPDSKDIESLETPQQRKRGSRLPADWSIPTDWGKWAVDEFGIAANAVRAEAERFRDYWIAQPGQKGIKLDWQATWRNWCRTAFTPKAAGRQPARQTHTSAFDELRGMIDDREQSESDTRPDRTIDGRLSIAGRH